MKNIIVAILVVASMIMINPTIAIADDRSANGVGFVAGSTYGFGIGYKHKFRNSPVAFQVAGLPIVTEEELILTGGLALQFTLHQGNYGSTFISIAASAIHITDRWVSQHDETLIAAGPGIGIEWRLYENFSFVFDVPAAAFFDPKEGFISLLPIPNVTLMYTW